MQYQFSAFDLHFLIKELRERLKDGRVDKVYQPQKKDFLLTFHVPSKGKHMLKINLPNVMYITEFKEEMPTLPPHFCLFLRKHLSGSFLREIRQCGFERVVEFIFENKHGKKHLIIEFFSRGNIILTESDYTIRSLLEIQAWKDRKLRGNVKYEFPQREYNPLEMDFSLFSQCIEKSDKEAVVKTLALDLGLGGRYAEELVYRAGVDKNQYYVDEDSKKKLFAELDKFRQEAVEPQVLYENDQPKAVLPLKLQTLEGNPKTFNSFNEALDNVLAGEKIETEKEKKLAPFFKKKRKLELQV
ncbi:MAG: NFACT family protein, partial [Nanobdellota archaeon]